MTNDVDRAIANVLDKFLAFQDLEKKTRATVEKYRTAEKAGWPDGKKADAAREKTYRAVLKARAETKCLIYDFISIGINEGAIPGVMSFFEWTQTEMDRL